MFKRGDRIVITGGPYTGQRGKILRREIPGRNGRPVYRVALVSPFATRRVAAENMAEERVQ